MSGRRPLVAGNWKMHKTGPEARAFCDALAGLVGDSPAADVAVCPPYTALEASAEVLASSPIAVYAQNVHENEKGAHTGDISSAMILATGADGALVGLTVLDYRERWAGDPSLLLRDIAERFAIAPVQALALLAQADALPPEGAAALSRRAAAGE